MTSRACEALAHGFIGFMGDLYLGLLGKAMFFFTTLRDGGTFQAAGFLV